MAEVTYEQLELQIQRGGVPIVIWSAQRRNSAMPFYDYCALYVHDTERWYLAGDAMFYGSSVMTTQEILHHLQAKEVRGVWRNTQEWKQLGDES